MITKNVYIHEDTRQNEDQGQTLGLTDGDGVTRKHWGHQVCSLALWESHCLPPKVAWEMPSVCLFLLFMVTASVFLLCGVFVCE